MAKYYIDQFSDKVISIKYGAKGSPSYYTASFATASLPGNLIELVTIGGFLPNFRLIVDATNVVINGTVQTDSNVAKELLDAFVGVAAGGSGGGGGGGGTQVQSDWAEADVSLPSYIKNKPTLSMVATSGSYNDLSDKPVVGTPIVSDVTEMFTTNSPSSRFVARMTGHLEGKSVIELYGQDTSGSSNNLIITASIGFGSDTEEVQNWRTYADVDSTIATDYRIPITPELSDGTQSIITVPNGCPNFYIKYFVGIGSAAKKSYYIRLDGTYVPFALDNTPIVNFCNSSSTSQTITVNGRLDNTGNIKEFYFGPSYSSITNTDNDFMQAYNRLEIIDLSTLSSLVTIRRNFLAYCSSLNTIIIGSVDWSSKNVSTTGLALNIPTQGTIYADSQSLGAAFKAKTSRLSNWTIVVNS